MLHACSTGQAASPLAVCDAKAIHRLDSLRMLCSTQSGCLRGAQVEQAGQEGKGRQTPNSQHVFADASAVGGIFGKGSHHQPTRPVLWHPWFLACSSTSDGFRRVVVGGGTAIA